MMSLMKMWEHLKISFAEIKEATNDFEKIVGTGGYGSVYEGKLSINGEHIKVAVKRLNEQIGQGLKEFLTEIHLLSCQQHENIITLVGYCDEGLEKIIVYEYAEHGSLDRYIKRSHKNYMLTWLERLRIVADVARGLDHLHDHAVENQTIIHRDIKTSNILLDDKWVAKISDLGLSKLAYSGSDISTVISHACGTRYYVEPEYFLTGLVHKKSDVYSFGMVLFEVLCGRLCYEKDNDGIQLLAEVAKAHYIDNDLDRIIDPILLEQMSPESFRKFSAIAYKCLQDRDRRPLMSVVKKELEETLIIQTQHVEMRRLKSLSISSEDDIIDDEYWKKKLPNRYQRYIQRSDKPLHYTNKKELYLRLCEGFLCDDGQLWFSMCKSTDGICSMLPAEQILHDDIEYENLDTLSSYESRFREVKILGYASSYSFTCALQLQMFAPQNMYACYLVFKFEHYKQPHDNCLFTAEYGLGHRLLGKVLVHMNVSSRNTPTIKPTTNGLEMKHDGLEYDVESWMEERNDGWMEVMLSKPLDKLEDQSKLKVRLLVLAGSFEGIIVEGIEFRPYI